MPSQLHALLHIGGILYAPTLSGFLFVWARSERRARLAERRLEDLKTSLESERLADGDISRHEDRLHVGRQLDRLPRASRGGPTRP